MSDDTECWRFAPRTRFRYGFALAETKSCCGTQTINPDDAIYP